MEPDYETGFVLSAGAGGIIGFSTGFLYREQQYREARKRASQKVLETGKVDAQEEIDIQNEMRPGSDMPNLMGLATAGYLAGGVADLNPADVDLSGKYRLGLATGAAAGYIAGTRVADRVYGDLTFEGIEEELEGQSEEDYLDK